MPFKKGNRR